MIRPKRLEAPIRGAYAVNLLHQECCCTSMPVLPCPNISAVQEDDLSRKYFREIGAEILGNQLTIRVERDKKPKKKKYQWDPPCDCDTIEIQRPTNKEGPKIVNGGNNNRILFQIHPNAQTGKDAFAYKPQAISYKVGSCATSSDPGDQCKIITVYPQHGQPGEQEVHTDRVTEGNENVFFLRIKKKPESIEKKKRNIELELRTPRAPTPPPPLIRNESSGLNTSFYKEDNTTTMRKK